MEVAVGDGGAGDGVAEGGGAGVCVAIVGTGVADGVEVGAAIRVMPGSGEAAGAGIVSGPQAAASIRINHQAVLAVFIICSEECASRAGSLANGLGQE